MYRNKFNKIWAVGYSPGRIENPRPIIIPSTVVGPHLGMRVGEKSILGISKRTFVHAKSICTGALDLSL